MSSKTDSLDTVHTNNSELKQILNDFVSNVLLHKPEDIFQFAGTYFTNFHKNPMENKSANAIIMCGPSGVGKGTLIDKLMAEFPQKFGFSVSHTTRAPRTGETDGKQYHFTTVEEMKKMIGEGKFVEHANVHKNMYGTSKEAVEKVIRDGRICILDIDVQGAQQAKKSSLAARYIFISPPSAEELEKRLRLRGTEKEESIQTRLTNAKGEIDFSKTPEFFDLVLVNDNLEKCYQTLKNFVFGVQS